MKTDARPTTHLREGLTEEQRSAYTRDGIVLLKGVFSEAEVLALGKDADDSLRTRSHLVHANNLRTRFAPHHVSGELVFEKFDPFLDLSPMAQKIVADDRIVGPLESIYGEPACLFKDKFIYKLPGTTGATLHQDWIGWPGFPESFITVLLAVDAFTAASGATEFFLGEHRNGYLSPVDTQHHHLDPNRFEHPPVPMEMNPGDVAIFSCFVPHRSAPNITQVPRRGYFISYNAKSDGGEQYHSHYKEFHRWLRTKYQDEAQESLYFE